ncbi:PAT1 domain containing protein [Pyrenophora teres f. teres]|uniref:PAT1 domain containing protein n=1 Tax=Pyrenophora teres f. teres TaxID=97479 RepID=A0A6S6VUI9_9PLEO|nr:PAT1 domain containing protein [Pyrenophora teres f. teres]
MNLLPRSEADFELSQYISGQHTKHSFNRPSLIEWETPTTVPQAANVGSATPLSSSNFRPSREFRARTPQEDQPQRLLHTIRETGTHPVRELLEAAAEGLAWGTIHVPSSHTRLLPPQKKAFNIDSVKNIWKDDSHPSTVPNGHYTHASTNASAVLPQRARKNSLSRTPYRAGSTSTISPNPAPFSHTNASSSRPVQSTTQQGTRTTGLPNGGHTSRNLPASTQSGNWRQRDNLPRPNPAQTTQQVPRQFRPTTFTWPQAPPPVQVQVPLQALPQALPRAPPRALPPSISPPFPQPEAYHTTAPPYIPAPISYNPQPAARYREPPGLGTRPGQYPPSIFEAILLDRDLPPVCPGCKDEMQLDCPRSGRHWSACTRARWAR